MQTAFDVIEKQAMQLSKKDRELLAEKLFRSLDDSLTDIDELWIAEAEKRYGDYLSGKTKGVPGDNLFREIRQELGWRE